MLNEKQLPKIYWAEAMNTAVYLINRMPLRAEMKVPYQLLFQRTPDLTHLRIFGCISYVKNTDEGRDKLDKKAVKCVFVGYSLERKTY